MKEYRVAVVGATGMVGRKMLQVLAERDFPVGELLPFASAKSAGKEIEYRGKNTRSSRPTKRISGARARR